MVTLHNITFKVYPNTIFRNEKHVLKTNIYKNETQNTFTTDINTKNS